MSSYYAANIGRTFDRAKWISLGVISTLLLLSAVGTVIELSPIGNDPDFDPAILTEASKFKTTK